MLRNGKQKLTRFTPAQHAPERAWLDISVAANDGDFLLFLHDVNALAVLRQLSRTLETSIKNVLEHREQPGVPILDHHQGRCIPRVHH
jgi:hypothetical protein